MSSYAPSEEWEAGIKESASEQEFYWIPDDPVVLHTLECPTTGISVLYREKAWRRHGCTGCNWSLTVSL